MRNRFLAIGVATLALAAYPVSGSAAPTDGVWMVTGGGGARGDCMSEFALQWDPAFDPTLSPEEQVDGVVPKFSQGGGEGRIEIGQQCQDGAGCDREASDTPHQCTFKVALCFCVDDPATSNCEADDETRGTWCRGIRANAESQLVDVTVNPLAYLLRSPSRTSKDHNERLARCRLERAVRGCVTDLDDTTDVPSKYSKFVQDSNGKPGPYKNNDECCDGDGTCNVCTADSSLTPSSCTNPSTPNCAPDDPNTLVAPVMTEANTTTEHRLETLVPGERVYSYASPSSTLKSPADDAGKTVFLMSRIAPTAGDPPLEREPPADCGDTCYGTAPARLYDDPLSYQQFVEADDFRAPGEDPEVKGVDHPFACSSFADIVVDLRRYRRDQNGVEDVDCDCSTPDVNGDGTVRTVPKKTVRINGDFWAGDNPYGAVDRGGGDELRLTCLEDGTDPAETCDCS